MNKEALFHDGTGGFVIPAEPALNEKITLRFRTAKDDVDFVRVVSGGTGFVMRKTETTGVFDFYELEWQLKEEMFSYSFEVGGKTEVCYFNRLGASKKQEEHYDFRIMPGFSTPDWAKGAVMYQIYVDRFYNGDPYNDVESDEYIYIGEPCARVTDWNKYPAHMGVREFYGGDLQGVLDKLDYLQELGVEVIYFNPLFVSPSNHKYDIQDYDYIDPHIGKIVKDGGEILAEGDKDNRNATKYQMRVTDMKNLEASNQLFIRLVEEMHRRGMKVILDGVFNHCGSFNKWLDRERIYEGKEGYEAGAFVSEDSPYRNYFRFMNEHSWPYNEHYDGWWGHYTLPKLNYEASKTLEEHILSIGRKWVSEPYNVDGWRLDVAADLGHSSEYNHEFWKKFRKAVKEANPEAIILAEHYGDPRSWLSGDEWDTVMNYDAFMEPVTWFLTGMEKHSDEACADLCGNAEHFIHCMKYHMANMLTPSLYVAMNELSNHDHSRFLTRTNRICGRVNWLGAEAANQGVKESVMREAVVMQMTWPGAPTIYYGDEAGVCGFTDPDNRRTYPWGNENRELLSFHKDIVRIHKENEGLRYGSLEILLGDYQLLSYGRFTETEQYLVVINNGDEFREVHIPVWRLGVPMESEMERLIYSYEDGYTIEKAVYEVHEGELLLNVGRKSATVLKTTCNSDVTMV